MGEMQGRCGGDVGHLLRLVLQVSAALEHRGVRLAELARLGDVGEIWGRYTGDTGEIWRLAELARLGGERLSLALQLGVLLLGRADLRPQRGALVAVARALVPEGGRRRDRRFRRGLSAGQLALQRQQVGLARARARGRVRARG